MSTTSAHAINESSVQAVATPLLHTRIAAELHDLVAITRWSQTYAHRGGAPIEAVFALPVPVCATFLGLELRVGGRRLVGQVAPRRRAQDTYERALADGDRTVLVEQSEQGMWTVSIGNLAPGIEVVIEVTYGELLPQAGEQVRLRIPTVFGPRYGISRRQPHENPTTSLLAENPFDLTLTVHGLLAGLPMRCRSHALSSRVEAGRVEGRIAGADAMLDRDIVIEWGVPKGSTQRAVAVRASDEWFVLAHLLPSFGAARVRRPLVLVLDCSGSMNGTSIQQVRIGLLSLFDRLDDGDRIAVLRFGSQRAWWRRELRAFGLELAAEARDFAERLQADLGGTEIRAALEDAIDFAACHGGADVLLVTDALAEDELPRALVERARASGTRVFAIGVGMAASERLLHQACSATGGAAELVTPNEGIGVRIERMLQRMRLPRSGPVRIAWPAPPLWQSLPDTIFSGDSALAVAGFTEPPIGSVDLAAEAGGVPIACQTAVERLDGASAAALARFAAARRLDQLTGEPRTEWAVRYQLVCDATACVVVDELAADAKVEQIARLVQVPQMLSAGYGGTLVSQPADFAFDIHESAEHYEFSALMQADAVAGAFEYGASADESPSLARLQRQATSVGPAQSGERDYDRGALASDWRDTVNGELIALASRWIHFLATAGVARFDIAAAWAEVPRDCRAAIEAALGTTDPARCLAAVVALLVDCIERARGTRTARPLRKLAVRLPAPAPRELDVVRPLVSAGG